MSKVSIPASGRTGFRLLLRTLRSSRLGKTLGRLTPEEGATPKTSSPSRRSWSPGQREHLDIHSANLERVVRLEEKAERLEKGATPSESARNRAERARGEILVGLAVLRASVVEAAGGKDGARAFDRVVEQRCPAFKYLSAAGGTR